MAGMKLGFYLGIENQDGSMILTFPEGHPLNNGFPEPFSYNDAFSARKKVAKERNMDLRKIRIYQLEDVTDR